MMKFLQLLTAVVFTLLKPAFAYQPTTHTVYLALGTSIDINSNSYGRNVLRTFCYPGKPRSLLSLFETVELILAISSDDYAEYGGRTPEEVLDHYNEKRSLFSFTLFSQKRQNIQLSPFEQQCIGISSNQPYNISLSHAQIDIFRLAQFCIGLTLFWNASRLAKNSVLYYLAGMVLGICASLLVLIAIVSKLFPRRPMMYGVLIGGWTIGLYILKQLSDNIRVILVTYREYVLWYLAITGLISFLVCYRIGPPRNPRSQNIIMWVLQAVGAAIGYFSSWHTSGCVILLVIVCAAHYCPDSLLKYVSQLYKRRFPPKRRLLTQEEYYEQAVNETARSLAELREYVNSPHCRQWSVIGSLKDPMRFATFANGAPHLFDEEIEDYSRTIEESLEGTNEEEALDLLQTSMYYRPTGRLIIQRGCPPVPLSTPTRLSPQERLPNNSNNDPVYEEDDDDDDEYTDQE